MINTVFLRGGLLSAISTIVLNGPNANKGFIIDLDPAIF
jgi:hypothetical protein